MLSLSPRKYVRAHLVTLVVVRHVQLAAEQCI